jgi:membrane protein DedA with SNARE-associated domain
MLLSASVTGGLVTVATHLINDAGYWGIFGLCLVSAVIFVPGDEVTMLFGGYAVVSHGGHHHMTIPGIIIAAIVGDMIGASIAFTIGYLGLHEGLERLPGHLRVSERSLATFNRWFERWGLPVVAISRIVPVVRGAGPYAAGIAKQAFTRFIVALLAGDLIWFIGLGLLGDAVGQQWQKWKNHLDYVDYVALVIIVALIGWWLYTKVWKTRGERRTETV